MVTTSYQCGRSTCPVSTITILLDETAGRPWPSSSSAPHGPLCPYCDDPCTEIPAPAAPAEAAGDVLDAIEPYHAGAADQVTQGDAIAPDYSDPPAAAFDPPALRLVGSGELTGLDPAELAKLRDTVTEEGPAEQIRNALQILAGILSYDGALLQDPTESTAAAIGARILAAAEDLPIGGAGGPSIGQAIAPFQTWNAAVKELAHSGAAHQEQARHSIVHAGQMLRFALNAVLNELGPGTAPVPAEILEAYGHQL